MADSAVAPRRWAARLCWALATPILAFCALYGASIEYGVAREVWLLSFTGYAALAALLLSLSMTPLRRLLAHWRGRREGSGRWLALRRAFGLTAAGFACLHAGVGLSTYLWDSWPTVLDQPYLRAGLVALVILALLALTSFPPLLRLLRIRLWQELHWLAYAAVIFAFQHALLSPFGERRWLLGLLGLFLLVSALRLLREKRLGAAPATAGRRP